MSTKPALDISGFADVESLVFQATCCLMGVDLEGVDAEKDAIYSMCLSVQQHFEDVEFDGRTHTLTDLCIAQALLTGAVFAVDGFARGAGQRDGLSWSALSLLKMALFLVSQELTEVRAEAHPIPDGEPIVFSRASDAAVTA